MGFSSKDLEILQKRVQGKKSTKSSQPASNEINPIDVSFKDCVILGVDPSLRSAGYGIIHYKNKEAKALAYGIITPPVHWTRGKRLAFLSAGLREQIEKYSPTICAIEGLFYAQNLKTALIMGEARGACLAQIAAQDLTIYEIAPRRVKLAMVGYGGAGKSAVAKMTQRMLRLDEEPVPDAADALGLALTLALEKSGAHLNAGDGIKLL